MIKQTSFDCRKSGFTLVELLVVIAIIAILAAIMFPIFSKAREKARQTQCLSYHRQMAAAIIMYTQDHEEKFPANEDEWVSLVNLGKIKCTNCPKNRLPGYGMNAFLYGKTLGEITNTSGVVLTADAVSLSTIIDDYSRHNSGTIESRVDGHVEYVRFQEKEKNGLFYKPSSAGRYAIGDFPVPLPDGISGDDLTNFLSYSGNLLTDAFAIAGPYGPYDRHGDDALAAKNQLEVNYIGSKDATGSAAEDELVATFKADNSPIPGDGAFNGGKINPAAEDLTASTQLFTTWATPSNIMGNYSLKQDGAYGGNFPHYTSYAVTYFYVIPDSANPTAPVSLKFNWMGDDCAIIWIDGKEVARDTVADNADVNSVDVGIDAAKYSATWIQPVAYKPGIHCLFIKLTNGPSGMKFAIKVATGNDSVKFSPIL